MVLKNDVLWYSHFRLSAIFPSILNNLSRLILSRHMAMLKFLSIEHFESTTVFILEEVKTLRQP